MCTIFYYRIDKEKIRPLQKKYESDAGVDISAYLDHAIVLSPQSIELIPTGIYLKISKGFEVQVRPRSGLALQGLIIVNSPGTIDAGYEGEVKVIVGNIGKTPIIIEPNMRIAQLVAHSLSKACNEGIQWQEIDTYEVSSNRGQNGFGSTGLK